MIRELSNRKTNVIMKNAISAKVMLSLEFHVVLGEEVAEWSVSLGGEPVWQADCNARSILSSASTAHARPHINKGVCLLSSTQL